MILLSMPGTERLSGLARRVRGGAASVGVHRVPDGEARGRLTRTLAGEDVVLVAGLDHPDERILPLLFAAATARELGAASVGLVAPYLPYLRQDRRFQPGEGVSARHVADLISGAVQWLVTVDPHLHRIPTLADLFDIPAEALHAAPLLAAWIRAHVEHPLILGPDAESGQWVAAIARQVDAPHDVFSKRRRGDRRVDLTPPDLTAHAGRRPVLVDDIVSSGVTMAKAVRALRTAGWPAPTCLAVHAIFADRAYDEVLEAGAATIVTCNTVAHASNRIDVEPLLAEAVARRLVVHHGAEVSA
jgi:ribose-phosphate pyrophosphokinase